MKTTKRLKRTQKKKKSNKLTLLEYLKRQAKRKHDKMHYREERRATKKERERASLKAIKEAKLVKQTGEG